MEAIIPVPDANDAIAIACLDGELNPIGVTITSYESIRVVLNAPIVGRSIMNLGVGRPDELGHIGLGTYGNESGI